MAHADLFPGQWQPQVVLMAALKVGLIEALLDAPLRPEEVAEQLALDERATLRVIGVLVDAGYLERQGDGVMVAPEAHALLDPSDAAFAGDRLLHLHDLLVRWVQLPQVLRDGGPAQSARTPESLRAFIGSMRVGARERAQPLADRLAALFPATQTVLDIGGGPGTQALAFQERGWQATVLDFPEVIDLMAEDLAQAGIATIKGDATQGIPTPDFDLVYCGNLFHSMSREECAAVVDGAADALRDGGALAIFDFLQGTGLPSSLFAVNMLVATSGGDVYGERDYRRWCEAAGLRDFAVHE
ncbi:MAG: methyltransferase domain-containing protein, partial [Actinobacteria bacterium]|nr:methyltransferase domain-containing protein [Actinomycetota bacterium]